MKKVNITEADVIEFCSNPNLISYCCLQDRPGGYAWMVEVEYTKFKPDTPANDGFHLTYSEWGLKGDSFLLPWWIMSIDKSGQEFAESILWKHGLKLSQSVPVMLSEHGSVEFHLRGPNIFYLENSSPRNVIYTN